MFFDFAKFIWIAYLAMFTASALAEQPEVVGHFQRGDGTTIRAVEMDMGGVIGFIGYLWARKLVPRMSTAKDDGTSIPNAISRR